MVYPTLHFDQQNNTTTICYNDTDCPKPFYAKTINNLKANDNDIMLEWYMMTCALLNQYNTGWEDGYVEGLYSDMDDEE